jgi:hypothetical protein
MLTTLTFRVNSGFGTFAFPCPLMPLARLLDFRTDGLIVFMLSGPG